MSVLLICIEKARKTFYYQYIVRFCWFIVLEYNWDIDSDLLLDLDCQSKFNYYPKRFWFQELCRWYSRKWMFEIDIFQAHSLSFSLFIWIVHRKLTTLPIRDCKHWIIIFLLFSRLHTFSSRRRQSVVNWIRSRKWDTDHTLVHFFYFIFSSFFFVAILLDFIVKRRRWKNHEEKKETGTSSCSSSCITFCRCSVVRVVQHFA